VGAHRDLLAYLVRRLLENGANSSFVTQLADPTVTVERLTENPVRAVRILGTVISNPRIPAPTHLYRQQRDGAPGIDFGAPDDLAALVRSLPQDGIEATALIGGKPGSAVQRIRVLSPADPKQGAGDVREASLSDVAEAMNLARAAQLKWSLQPVSVRASILERAAALLLEERPQFIGLLVREAGRTLRNAIGEWREAIDFLRFYAAEAERLMIEHELPGPTGESNVLTLHGKGVFACISPWNFPLSIFMGQVAAALVTGNAVLAKPAGETPLTGFKAVQLLHRAGVPENILHFLPGGPAIGAEIVAQPDLAGVVFTGSTATARRINAMLAAKPGPLTTLIAETGGQNVMIVDSSALIEQVVGDIVASAYDSAGQRCSALRILAVQEDIAEPLITMLQGAVALLKLGDPADPVTDIGPVISEAALKKLQSHVRGPRFASASLFPPTLTTVPAHGHFMAPQLLEIRDLSEMTEEVFGPVLHVIRWKSGQLEALVERINDLGYGLTLALQSRIGSSVETVTRLARVGNLYVNRSQIGAVVGSQPFGGEGLSGTGPKAGGTLYLQRFVTERVVTINTAAAGGNAGLLSEPDI
jgi:RHH-type proline utilization regulon transcriptional repressor/proline dehydrogenase/delta 1-pyrroline-5-carboxylate dehydrogenase